MHATDSPRLRAIGTTLVAGGGGGLLFAMLGLPAAWISGSMLAIMVLAMAGVRLHLPHVLRQAAFVILGASMGSVLTPQMMARASAWPISMVVLAVSIVATMAGSILFLNRVAGWDKATAFFASAPGALSTIIAMAADSGADLRRVAFAQAVRLFLLVAALPSLLSALHLTQATDPAAMTAQVDGLHAATLTSLSGLRDLSVLLLAALVVGLVAERLRVPGGLILGALLASGALHLREWTDVAVPPALLLPAFTLLGINVGVRFVGTRLSTIVTFIRTAMAAFVVSILISAGFALLASMLTGDDFGKMLAAFAPGALEAMTALGFALGYDPAFMSAHHVFRFASLSVLLPVAARLLFSMEKKSAETDRAG
ncbi:AbrB family transcriptional regulator [Xanthobacter sp. TB0139]|uniref:AbrB family transcriptional regulator n=1 Tax=Xanthobacter sp. TB0139 TaxID=3459178 RepID=UPI0040394C3D